MNLGWVVSYTAMVNEQLPYMMREIGIHDDDM
jgi:hypothetical protein